MFPVDGASENAMFVWKHSSLDEKRKGTNLQSVPDVTRPPERGIKNKTGRKRRPSSCIIFFFIEKMAFAPVYVVGWANIGLRVVPGFEVGVTVDQGKDETHDPKQDVEDEQRVANVRVHD